MTIETVERLARTLGKATQTGDGWACLCPVHDDHEPSLSLSIKNNKILWYCHAKCPQNEVGDEIKKRFPELNEFYSSTNKNRLPREIEKDRKEHEETKKKRHEEVANESAQLWENLSLTGSSPYLERKKVKSFEARFEKDSIRVPLYDIENKLWNLQTIYHNGSKIYQKGAKKKGCFYTLGLLTESETIFICEGFATGASIYEATQIPTVVAFDVVNLDPVTAEIRSHWPDKRIVICADNDQWKEKNVGIESATAVANKYSCEVAYPDFSDAVAKEKQPTDFNDLHVFQSLKEVKDQIDKVMTRSPKVILPTGFSLSKTGLYFKAEEAEKETWICSPIEVLTNTREEFNQNWGRLVKFKDLDSYVHTLAISMESFKGDCSDFYGLLLSRGLRITTQWLENYL